MVRYVFLQPEGRRFEHTNIDNLGNDNVICVINNAMSTHIPLVPDQDNTPLIVGITIPFILVLILCMTVFILRSRRKNVRKTTESRNADNMSLQDSIVETRYVKTFTWR